MISQKLFQPLWRPIRRTILKYIFPVTDAPEFKAIYPVLVVTLGVLAASRLDGIRSTVVAVALVCIATGAVAAIVRDRQKITLQHAWNVLFISYYRPFGISLTQRVSHAGHNPTPVDLLTYRTGDFIKSLADAAADFAQVSASGKVNIATFDIEYIPLLREGIPQEGLQLLSLRNIWESKDADRILSYKQRIPEEVQSEIYRRLGREDFYALPIGWGLVGVCVIHPDLSLDAVNPLLTKDNRGFCFETFAENVRQLQKLEYEIICFDFWNGLGQMASLYQTGHLTLENFEYGKVSTTFDLLLSALDKDSLISDPQLLLKRARNARKCIIIGGSTWLGLRGTLLPVSVSGGLPAYGAFCECVGILSPPEGATDASGWQSDATRLITWIADNLSDRSAAPKVGAGSDSIVNNYIPGLLASSARKRKELNQQQPMHWDPDYAIAFRDIPKGSLDQANAIQELWVAAKSKAFPPNTATQVFSRQTAS